MARSAAALGHMGILFGILGMILVLAMINNAVTTVGGGGSIVYTAVFFWFIGVLFVGAEWFVANRSNPSTE